MSNTSEKKLSTGITGLDELFYGGIHTHKNESVGNQNGILMLARGQHGVNKIHLAMQICEGLYNSYTEDSDTSSIIEQITQTIEQNLRITTYYSEFAANKDTTIKPAFEEIIKDTKDANDQKVWKDRKKKFEEKYDEWFNEIASQLPSIDTSDQEIVQKKNAFKRSYDELFKDNKGSYDDKYTSFIKSYYELSNSYNKKIETEVNNLDAKNAKNLLKSIYISEKQTGQNRETRNQKILFISINKNSHMLKNSYYDYYIQRLIKDIREHPIKDIRKHLNVTPYYGGCSNPTLIKKILSLHSMPWMMTEWVSLRYPVWRQLHAVPFEDIIRGYCFPTIRNEVPSVKASPVTGVSKFINDIQTGFIYYNGRTHGLHIQHQKGAKDKGDLLMNKVAIPDDYKVKIIGKDTLNGGSEFVDGLTTFQQMMNKLDEYRDSDIKFIMIDGLSRLNEEELAQCPLNALSDKLRKMSTVAIITADEKLLPSEISTDIVIDMDIRQSERSNHQYTALKISKCLYQKNAYGWHQYKMRNAGIEVIPSIHLQIGQRFLMDDIVTDAILPIHEFPYPFWLNENRIIYEDNNLHSAKAKHIESSGTNSLQTSGVLKGFILNKGNTKSFFSTLFNEESHPRHWLFVSFDKNRTDFYDEFINRLYCDKRKETIHFFHFRPGYYHPDEILWVLNRQIKAIESVVREATGDKDLLSTHYTHVSLVLGDLNYIHYAFPNLSAEPLLLPALATYTKKHHMKNYVYATLNPPIKDLLGEEHSELHKKEIETIMQIQRISSEFKDLTKDNR